MPMPRAAPVTSATRMGSDKGCAGGSEVAGERLLRLDQLDPDPVGIDHVHGLASLVRPDVRALDLGDELNAGAREPLVELVETVDVEAQVRRAGVRRRRIDGMPVDLAVLEHLEEEIRERQPEDRDVQLDAGVADELLDVLLVAHPARHELEAEQVAVERNGPLEVGDLDAEVADAVEAVRDRSLHDSGDCTTGVVAPSTRTKSGTGPRIDTFTSEVVASRPTCRRYAKRLRARALPVRRRGVNPSRFRGGILTSRRAERATEKAFTDPRRDRACGDGHPCSDGR